MAEKIKLFSQYKFVLAFENNNVTDYVTEKLPHAFLSTLIFLVVIHQGALGGALPIYMGAPNIDEWVPAQMSIVKTSDFSGPEVDFLEQKKNA